VIQVGAITMTPVIDAVVPRVPTEAYDATSATDWGRHPELLDADGFLRLTLGGYVVRTADRVVLVDAGIGPEERPVPGRGITMPGGKLLEHLLASGTRPEEVTDVVFTHLHLDHVGWGAVDGAITFPNAIYRCHQADWDHFAKGGSLSAPEKLATMAPAVECWSSDETLAPGVDVVHAPGHTPGSSIVVVSDGAERAVLLGDVVHCPAELVDEEWQTIADVDPELARRTATRLARELEGQDVTVGAAHFPELRFGRLLVAEGQRRWVFDG
jgi:glyoxylase-like metal-dependent hydrolase (beta-lactamase superfamily II)